LFKERFEAQKQKYLEYVAWVRNRQKSLESDDEREAILHQEQEPTAARQNLAAGNSSLDVGDGTWDTGLDMMSKVASLSKWEDEPELERMCVEIIWSVIHILLDKGLLSMANGMWHSVRLKTRPFTAAQWESIKERYTEQEERPDTIDEWIEENISYEGLPSSCGDSIHDDPQELILVRPFHPDSGRNNRPTQKINPWFIERILDKGHFYYGHLTEKAVHESPLAIFDVDGPSQVLLPYSVGMEDFGPQWNGALPTMRSKRISWIVTECPADNSDVRTGADGLFRSFSSNGMVAGMWSLGDTEPKRYNLR